MVKAWWVWALVSAVNLAMQVKAFEVDGVNGSGRCCGQVLLVCCCFNFCHLFVRSFVCLFVCLFICMFVCLYVCLFVCMFLSVLSTLDYGKNAPSCDPLRKKLLVQQILAR